MRLWIDTEFNYFGGQLLSMALVSQLRTIFYVEMEVVEEIHPWVAEHVMPHIENPICTHPLLTSQLEGFLNLFDEVEIIADWPDDIKYLVEALIIGPGYMIDTPPLTFTLRRELQGQSQVPHHAQWDAIANMEHHLELEM